MHNKCRQTDPNPADVAVSLNDRFKKEKMEFKKNSA